MAKAKNDQRLVTERARLPAHIVLSVDGTIPRRPERQMRSRSAPKLD